jgi:glycosyltransferase involved in cell wall biosynthesis
MRIVALLGVRNEELYMERCLEHLFQQGVEICVIDNGSTDGTLQIAGRFLGRGVFRIEQLPFPGYFDLVGQLKFQEQLATEIDADWFIHHDADEIREAPTNFATLREGIVAADADGYSAIDFEEFVFIPTSVEDQFENTDYVANMRHYYFFSPCDLHRVNAWKKTTAVQTLVRTAGHQIEFSGRRIYPTKFILRHYIALSDSHVRRKYGKERVYSQREIEERGWHRARSEFIADQFRLPAIHHVKSLRPGSNMLDRSDPKTKHLIFK